MPANVHPLTAHDAMRKHAFFGSRQANVPILHDHTDVMVALK